MKFKDLFKKKKMKQVEIKKFDIDPDPENVIDIMFDLHYGSISSDDINLDSDTPIEDLAKSWKKKYPKIKILKAYSDIHGEASEFGWIKILGRSVDSDQINDIIKKYDKDIFSISNEPDGVSKSKKEMGISL